MHCPYTSAQQQEGHQRSHHRVCVCVLQNDTPHKTLLFDPKRRVPLPPKLPPASLPSPQHAFPPRPMAWMSCAPAASTMLTPTLSRKPNAALIWKPFLQAIDKAFRKEYSNIEICLCVPSRVQGLLESPLIPSSPFIPSSKGAAAVGLRTRGRTLAVKGADWRNRG